MGVKSYDYNLVTGLANSGVTDGSGAWNTGVDLSAFLTGIPVGAKGVRLKIYNASASAQWAGVRINGRSVPELLKDLPGGQGESVFIEHFGGITVDLYLESASISFSIEWVLDNTWHFFPEGERPLIPSNGGNFGNETIAECPANSTAITLGFRWRPTGETTNITNNPSGQQLIKLDGTSTFSSAAAQSIPVIGYTTGAVNWLPWLGTRQSYTADSTWRASANTFAGGEGVVFIADKNIVSSAINFREGGSAYNPSLMSTTYDENLYSGLSDTGTYDYFVETGAAYPIYIVATIPAAETEILISSLDQSVTGLASVADFNVPFAATSFSITGDAITKNAAASTVDGDTASFVTPQWVDLETCVSLGEVIVTATDGVDTTADYPATLSMQYQHPDAESPVPFTYVVLTSVSAEALAVLPLLQVDAQVAFDSSRCDVGLDGRVTFDSYSGQSALLYRNTDDKIARLVIIDTSGGSTVAPVMPADQTLTVYEGATTLGTFPAAGGTPPISYAIGGDDAALFTINTATAKVDPVGSLTTGQNGVITITATNSAGDDIQTINWSVIAAPEPSPDDYQRFPKGSTLKGLFIKGQTLKGKYL